MTRPKNSPRKPATPTVSPTAAGSFGVASREVLPGTSRGRDAAKPDERALAFAMREAGWTWKRIAAALGRHVFTVQRWWRLAGRPRRPKSHWSPGDIVGGLTLVRVVPGTRSGRWLAKTMCGHITVVAPLQAAKLGQKVCADCYHESAKKDFNCDSCGTKNPKRFGHVRLKSRCLRCDRRGQRNGYCDCGAALSRAWTRHAPLRCPRGCKAVQA